MRLARAALLISTLWMAGAGQSAEPADIGPAEAPPASFAGRQYIDSTGCVFLRSAGGGWQARLDSQGVAICGYPPTPVVRDADAQSLSDIGERTSSDPSRIGGSGRVPPWDVLADTAPADGPDSDTGGNRPDAARMPGMPADLTQQLEAAMATAPRIAAASAMTTRDSRLCEMIGAEARSGHADGATSMLGHCGASIISSAARAETARTGPRKPEGQAVMPKAREPARDAAPEAEKPADKPAIASQGGPARQPERNRSAKASESPSHQARGPKPATPPARQTQARSNPSAATPAVLSEEMIPADARYFVISHHPGTSAADRAARRLAQAGFPAAIGAARGTGQQVLLAGPFPGREAMVRARSRLIQAGFTPLAAR